MGNAPLEIRDEKRLIKPKFSQISRFLPNDPVFTAVYMRFDGSNQVPMFLTLNSKYNKLALKTTDKLYTYNPQEDIQHIYDRYGFIPAEYIYHFENSRQPLQCMIVLCADHKISRDDEFNMLELGYEGYIYLPSADNAEELERFAYLLDSHKYIFVLANTDVIPDYCVQILENHKYLKFPKHDKFIVSTKLQHITAIYHKHALTKEARYICLFGEHHEQFWDHDYIQIIHLLLKNVDPSFPIYLYIESSLERFSYDVSQNRVEINNPKKYIEGNTSIEIDRYRHQLCTKILKHFEQILMFFAHGHGTPLTSLYFEKVSKTWGPIYANKIHHIFAYAINITMYIIYYINKAIILGTNDISENSQPEDCGDNKNMEEYIFEQLMHYSNGLDQKETLIRNIYKADSKDKIKKEDLDDLLLIKQDAYSLFQTISDPPKFDISQQERERLQELNKGSYFKVLLEYIDAVSQNLTYSGDNFRNFIQSLGMRFSVSAYYILDFMLIQSIFMTPPNSIIVVVVGNGHRKITQSLLCATSNADSKYTDDITHCESENFQILSDSDEYFNDQKNKDRKKSDILQEQILDIVITLEANLGVQTLKDTDGDTNMTITSDEKKGGAHDSYTSNTYPPDSYTSNTYTPNADILIGIQAIVIIVILVAALFIHHITRFVQARHMARNQIYNQMRPDFYHSGGMRNHTHRPPALQNPWTNPQS